MGQVKIYGLKENIDLNRIKISDAIHLSIVESLKFPEEKRFQRFIKLDKEDYIFPNSRTKNYLIIEIIMFKGRSDKTKSDLISNIFKNIGEMVGIDTHDVEITLIEEAPCNWGIRGKVGSNLKINYEVEI